MVRGAAFLPPVGSALNTGNEGTLGSGQWYVSSPWREGQALCLQNTYLGPDRPCRKLLAFMQPGQNNFKLLTRMIFKMPASPMSIFKGQMFLKQASISRVKKKVRPNFTEYNLQKHCQLKMKITLRKVLENDHRGIYIHSFIHLFILSFIHSFVNVLSLFSFFQFSF